MKPSRSGVTRRIAAAVAMGLALTLAEGVTAAPVAGAQTGGPSVPLPTTPSTPVTEQTMGSRAPDQAGSAELSGEQVDAPAPAGGGTPTATSLSPSATWEVSARTGDFTWSYPLRVPPAPGGLAPSLALSYSSGSVDGRTSATNNQASWIGDGWDLSPGFVERTYGLCAQDEEGDVTPEAGTGDLCWRSDNATATYNGGGGMLIKDDATGKWAPKNDDGARVERLVGASNGDNGGEHWKITTVDGTQYFYGSRSESSATWTVPVFGDDTGEPCHQATFATSDCTQGWRWNLDKVIDRHGNMILYTYAKETNSYGRNKTDTAVSYDRGGYLQKIEYGLRAGGTAVPAAGRVDFVVADRCVPGIAATSCVFDKPGNWPDVPWSSRCAGETCKDKPSPTFWTVKRLAKIVTRVRSGTSYPAVDTWDLTHSFPSPGDGEKAALWLKSVKHTGNAGGTATLPEVSFEGTKFANRVEKDIDVGPLNRYRVTAVVSESGGVVAVTYAEPNCVAGSMPVDAHTNTKRCYPARWQRDFYAERTDYFHKYVVAHVTTSDMIGTSPEQKVAYEYLGGAAWHYDTSEFVPPAKKTWNEFRGYEKVRIRTGDIDDPGGPVSMTEQRFYRGMHGDRATPDGGTRSESVADSENGLRVDHDWLQGQPVETATYNGADVVGKTVSWPDYQGPTATRGSYKAYIVRTGEEKQYTALASGGWRTTHVHTKFDAHGLPTEIDDHGDLGTSADDRCTRIGYEREFGAWLIDFRSRTETVAVNCAGTPSFPADAISEERLSYDGHGYGAGIGPGNVTEVRRLTERPASGPVFHTVRTQTYDSHGRVRTSADALNRTTRTDYTPALGGPLTQVVVTNPLGHKVTTEMATAWGSPKKATDPNLRVTETAFDPLGRAVSVWLPNRPRGATTETSPNLKYSYKVSRTELTVVTSEVLGPNGNYVTTKTLYDGLYRPRQKQAPAPGGGRLLTDTRYDRQGRPYKQTAPYFQNGAVDDRLWVAADNAVPGITLTKFDGAGRAIAAITYGHGVEKWRSTMAYGGDRVHLDPPDGDTAGTVINDARGRPVERRTYAAPTPTGAYDSTTYTYAPAGQLATVTDPENNVWRFHHDLRGFKVKTEDPDKGPVIKTFDDAGQVLTSTDARGMTLAYEYDGLGRQKAEYHRADVDTKLTEWAYDTATKGVGQVASATRFLGGNAYTSKIESYNSLYKPVDASVTIPEAEGHLQGTYRSSSVYNVDGSLAGTIYPAAGDLPEETVSHSYDDSGRPLTMTGGLNGTTQIYIGETLYTRYGRTERLLYGEKDVLGGRAWQSYLYDDETGRLTRSVFDTEVYRPTQSDVTYGYDPAGNVTSIADQVVDRPADVQCFRYDHLRRLTEAWTPGSDCGAVPSVTGLAGPAPYWTSYGYDKVGNRTTEVKHGTGGDTTRGYTYARPGSHQLDSVTSTGPAGTVSSGYTYDAIGNTRTRTDEGSTQNLDWDPEGELIKITEGAATTEYAYYAGGGRMLRREPGATTLYLGTQEIRLDRTTGVKTATRYYKHGNTTVAMRTGNALTWLASDHHGTTEIAVDRTTMATTRRRHAPFGVERGPSVAFPGEKGFVGGTKDASAGLTMLGARMYDSAIGRFISVDPVMDVSDPQQMHGYTYSNNSPITYSDPTGMFLWGFDDWVSDNVLEPAWDGVTWAADNVAEPVAGFLDRNLGEPLRNFFQGAYRMGSGLTRAVGAAFSWDGEAWDNAWEQFGHGWRQAGEGVDAALVVGGIVCTALSAGLCGAVITGVGLVKSGYDMSEAVAKGDGSAIAEQVIGTVLGAFGLGVRIRTGDTNRARVKSEERVGQLEKNRRDYSRSKRYRNQSGKELGRELDQQIKRMKRIQKYHRTESGLAIVDTLIYGAGGSGPSNHSSGGSPGSSGSSGGSSGSNNSKRTSDGATAPHIPHSTPQRYPGC